MASSPLQWHSAFLFPSRSIGIHKIDQLSLASCKKRVSTVERTRIYPPPASRSVPYFTTCPIVGPISPEDSDKSDTIVRCISLHAPTTKLVQANGDANPTSSPNKEKKKVSIKTEKVATYLFITVHLIVLGSRTMTRTRALSCAANAPKALPQPRPVDARSFRVQ